MSQQKPPPGDFLPCPHCESKKLKVYKGSPGLGAAHHGQMVKCMDCGARSGYYLTYENLVKGWNRRIPTKPFEGEIVREVVEKSSDTVRATIDFTRPNWRRARAILAASLSPGIYARTVSAQELDVEDHAHVRLPGPKEEWPSYEDACDEAGVTLCLVGSEDLYNYLTEKAQRLREQAEAP